MPEKYLRKIFTKVNKDDVTFTGILRAYSEFLKDQRALKGKLTKGLVIFR